MMNVMSIAPACTFAGCKLPRVSRWRCANHYASAGRGCKIEACDRKHYGSGMCKLHWSRTDKTGEPGTAELIRVSGRICLIDGCNGAHVARGYCRKHYLRVQSHGDPDTVVTFVPDALPGDQNPNWRGDDAGYSAVHWRLKGTRGKASDLTCECGKSADQWSYGHSDPNAQMSERGHPYSTDLTHYAARCFSCHTRLDHDHMRRMKVG